MTTENQPDNSPSSSWYYSVNRLLGWCWGVIPPVTAGLMLHWPQWVTVTVTLVWYVLNIRVMDRYIPLVGNPMVEWVYRLFHSGRGGR